VKSSTSLNRLKVLCEGATDIPVFDELVGQVGEVPEIVFGDVAGWPGLRNKDPDFLLLGSKAVIENYLPRHAVERVLGMDLSAYFPVPQHVPFTKHLSEDNKGPRYRFRRWVASKLDLKMPQPRHPLYSKSRNRDVAKVIDLQADLAGTDLLQIVQSIVQRARELQED
jgi:hypothetical protein